MNHMKIVKNTHKNQLTERSVRSINNLKE
jgi:hypothetical protein